MKIQEKQKGSYTVEAALLMGLILPVLVGIIYMGFFLHDRSFTQAAAHEAAVYASLHADDKKADAESAAGRLIKGRLLGTADMSGSSSADEKSVQISYHGNFKVPGMVMQFWAKQEVVSKVNLTIERPSRRIRKIRGLVKAVRAVRGKES